MTDPEIRLSWARVDAAASRRAVAWRLLRDLAGRGAVLSNPCPRCGGPHGPVRVDGSAHVASVAYAMHRGTGDTIAVVAVAASDAATAIGVDAEWEVDPVRDAAGGIADLRAWVRTEAALKADGRGLRVDPASVVLAPDRSPDADISPHADRIPPDGPRFGISPRLGTSWWAAEVPGAAAAIRGRDVDGPPGVLVSVAWR